MEKKKWKKGGDKVGERVRTEDKITNNVFLCHSHDASTLKKKLTTQKWLLADETCLKGLRTFAAAPSNASSFRTPL